MRLSHVFVLLLLLKCSLLLGCPDQDVNLVKPIIDDLTTMGETKDPEAPGTPTSQITYYRDADLTKPVTETVEMGTTLYTLVTFLEEVPVVISDDEDARPGIFYSIRTAEILGGFGSWTKQYRMKPPGSDLQSGDAMPYHNGFLCKYVVGIEDFAENFLIHTDTFEGDPLTVILYSEEGWGSQGEYAAPVRENPNDFVGVVCAIRLHPVADAAVTIVTGPRAGERAITDRNGHYTFPDVATNELHLRVEKDFFQPKEVIAFKDRQTILANGDRPNFHNRSKDPGVIQIGQRWPDEVRPILENVLVVHDLLYYEGSTVLEERKAHATYASASGMIQLNTDRLRYHILDPAGTLLHALAHEIMHAHQHALISVDGQDIDYGRKWAEDTPEGRTFAEARRKDLEEFGRVAPYDTIERYDTLLYENAAEVFAYYWIAHPRGMAGYAKLEDVAPYRFAWAKEWFGD